MLRKPARRPGWFPLPPPAQMYQAFSAPAAAIPDQCVATLQTSAGSYLATEAANAAAAG